MRDFKKLQIWQLGMDIVNKVYDLVATLPKDERFGMIPQMTRSAISISANIAEGSAKRSAKDYLRYVGIAEGSAFELETHSLIVQQRKWTDEQLIEELLNMIRREQSMLSKFIEKLEA